jgi:hypothetical protein
MVLDEERRKQTWTSQYFYILIVKKLRMNQHKVGSAFNHEKCGRQAASLAPRLV